MLAAATRAVKFYLPMQTVDQIETFQHERRLPSRGAAVRELLAMALGEVKEPAKKGAKR